MASVPAPLQSIRYRRGHLELLDQVSLPQRFEYESIQTVDAAWQAIRTMKVRGAPAIAISAVLGLAVEVWHRRHEFTSPNGASDYLCNQLAYLSTARPTAINLGEVVTRLAQVVKRVANSARPGGEGAQQVIEGYLNAAEQCLEMDLATNRAIGRHGADFLASSRPELLSVLTHCNTGSLATAGFGTALGVIRTLHEARRLAHVYATETRPFNQGARLTAFELVYDRIPGTLITDSMAAFLMARGKVDGVVVGADRVVASGDTANKIGTYSLALAAAYHHIPFLVAAPTTSIDMSLEWGSQIPIEERPAKELTHVAGNRVAAEGIGVWNPSFDVTPACLVSAIVTERGVITRADGASTFNIAQFLEEAPHLELPVSSPRAHVPRF